MTDVGNTDVGQSAGAPAGEGGSNPLTEGTASAAPADWRTGLSEDLRASPALHDVGDVNSLAKQFVDLQAHMGNALRIPGPDAGDADMAAFRTRLREKMPSLMETPDPTDPAAMAAVYDAMGRPAGAEDYAITAPPEGSLQYDEGTVAAYAQLAHENGFSQAQFENVMAGVLAHQNNSHTEMLASIEHQQAELRGEWGATYDQRMQAVAEVAQQLEAPPEVLDALAKGLLGKGSAKFLYNIVRAVAGETQLAAQPQANQVGITPQEADMQIAELMRKPEYRNHEIHVRQPIINKIEELMRYAMPDALHGDEAARDLKRSSG